MDKNIDKFREKYGSLLAGSKGEAYVVPEIVSDGLIAEAKKSGSDGKYKFARVVFLLVLFMSVILYFNLTNYYLFAGIIITALAYAVLRKNLWVLIALSLPALTLGQFIFIPITYSWVYEASLSEILIVLAAIVFFLDIYIVGGIKKIKFDALFFALALYSILGLLSYFYIENLTLFVAGLKAPVYSALAYFLALNTINTPDKRRWAYVSLAALAAILSAQIFHTFYSMGFSSSFFYDRSNIRIPFGAIALVAALLAMVLPSVMADFFARAKEGRKKILVLIAFAMGATALFSMLGKAAIISFFFGLSYFFFKQKRFRQIYIFSSILGLILFFLLFSPLFNAFIERARTAFVDKNLSFRVEEYAVDIQIIKEHPFLGLGSGQQLHEYELRLFPDYRNFANNFIMQAALDYGTAGIIAVSVLIFAFGLKLKKMRKSFLATGLAASTLAAFMNGMAEVTFFALPYAIVFWVMVGSAEPQRSLSLRGVSDEAI
jgi:O-antigen ligase